ncbi:MAG: hypothetical protein WBL93_07645 [Lutisporaceae bacterium]
MDLVNRYVYAVTKRLSEKQREDIEKELRTLIDDMLEQYEASEAYEIKVQKVLLDLGDPEIMANNYRSTKSYLIGPQNFDNYILILKIVMGAVFLGISISVVVGSIFASQLDIVGIFTDYLGTLTSALLQGFAWVTIIFAVAEYKGVDMKGSNLKGEKWSLSELPLIPEKKAAISPWESIVSILFSAIFMTIFYFAPQLFAAYITNDINGTTIIPIFNLDILNTYRTLFVVIFIFSVLKEALKLISGRWTLKLSVVVTVLSIATTVLMVMVFTNPAIWNPNFSVEIMQHLNLSMDFNNIWIHLTSGFIFIMVAACIIDVSTALYKGVKYNISK